MNKNNGAIIAAIILGVLLVGALIWGISQSSSKKKLETKTKQMTEQVSELELLKSDLEREVDSLIQEYQVLAGENEELQGSLGDAEAKLVSAKRALNSATSERNNLRAEIQALMAAKTELQGNIQALQAENDSLKLRMGILEEDLAMTTEEKKALAQMNQTIQDEVKRLTLANFKASGFRVVPSRKNDKVTTKSKKVRSLDVSFDLAEVPAKYQGVRPVYLSITDSNGNPIQAANPVKASSMVNGEAVELIAQEVKEVNIGDNQRLTFTHELDDKLDPGIYRAAVYTDIGLLGASSFQLR